MILLDANILLHAVNRDAPLHRQAKRWLEKAISGSESVALCWIVILAFLRLTTRPGLFQRPLKVAAALEIVEAWLRQPSVVVVHPGPRHLALLRELLLEGGTGGNLTTDAALAALAIEHGASLCSCDRDFGRFRRLKWMNPLE